MSIAEETAAGAFRLVEGRPEDFEEIAALYGSLLETHGVEPDDAAVRAKLRAMLAAPYDVVFLRSGAEPVALAIAMDMGDHVFIRDLVVAEGSRSGGIGRAFFERLRRRWAGRPMRLEAAADHAVAFWEKMGFAIWSVGMRSDPDSSFAPQITLEGRPC